MVSSTGKRADPQHCVQGHVGTQQTGVCEPPRPGHHREQKGREGLHRIDRVGGSETKRQMLAHRFAIAYLPQKLEKHHQPAERRDRTRGLAQFHFLPAPKRGNFPVHCFVLLGVSFIQLKLNRVRAKQCNSISEFRFNRACIYRFRAKRLRPFHSKYADAAASRTVRRRACRLSLCGPRFHSSAYVRVLFLLTAMCAGAHIHRSRHRQTSSSFTYP